MATSFLADFGVEGVRLLSLLCFSFLSLALLLFLLLGFLLELEGLDLFLDRLVHLYFAAGEFF